MGITGYLLVAGCIFLETTEQICYRLAGKNRARYVTFVAPGIAAHITRLALWYLLLKTQLLGVALPLMGANYIMVALAGRILFHERVDARRWIGTALIVAGCALVGNYPA